MWVGRIVARHHQPSGHLRVMRRHVEIVMAQDVADHVQGAAVVEHVGRARASRKRCGCMDRSPQESRGRHEEIAQCG